MKKQTAVEFLIQQIEIALELNKVQINFEYRIKTINPVYEIARKMEREQIIEAFIDGEESEYQYHVNAETKLDAVTYYNETYKGGEE